MKIADILRTTRGKLLSGDSHADIDLSLISTDSRTIKKGEFFAALSGPNFCGSRFLNDAFKRGAIGAIFEKAEASPIDRSRILIKVKDATKALRDIAAAHRAKYNIPVIAVTGSNGKTTVKEMIAGILSAKHNILKNEGTKNNHIGVPQTLLKLNDDHDMCVLEFGTNHKGEIRALSKTARPTSAVITNIGPSHLEHFKNLEGIYDEKMDILRSLPHGSTAIINGDDMLLGRVKPRGLNIVKYGIGRSNDFRAAAISSKGRTLKFRVNDVCDCTLNLLGAHNIYNALAAIAAVSQFDISISVSSKVLFKFKPALMRLNPIKINGIWVINDAYNSNPASFRSALEAIKSYGEGSRWIVSGDMLELGRESALFHSMVGRLIADSSAAGLFTLGDLSRHMLAGALAGGMEKRNLMHCRTHNEIADKLRTVVKSGDIVLVKGSRGMRMENVMERLRG